MDNSVIIAILIILLLTLFIIAVFIGAGLSNNPPQITIATQSGQFLSVCASTGCAPGLSCDGTTFTCKSGTGIACNNSSDCLTGLICSGLCVTGPTGGLNDYCPCLPGYICVSNPNVASVCKGSGGNPCTSDNDCASGFCNNNICATGAPISFPCTQNSSCTSLNCNNGFCQNPGIVTGTPGAACAGSCVGFTGAACNTGLLCECNSGPNTPGVCVAATQGILSSCSNLAACSSDLVCYGTAGNSCDNQTNCLCTFSYTDPNSQPLGSNCINGMSPANNSCFNNNGLGCDTGLSCINSQCAGAPVLAFYQFTNSNGTNVGPAFPGALDTSIIGLTGLPGNIQPHKMFATSNNNIDTIYLVDYIQGLLSIQINPYTSTIISPWTQLLPYESGGKTLIDVGYNNEIFVVAYNQGVFDTVYAGTNLNNLTPFNVQSGPGLPGTQYTTRNVALTIDYIDISPGNDISSGGDILISNSGTIFIKTTSATKYSIGNIEGGPMNGKTMTGVTGPARFYYDTIENTSGSGNPVCPEDASGSPIQCPSSTNISFIGPFQPYGTTTVLPQVLQFSGNIAGIALPIDRFGSVNYNVFDYDIYSPAGIGMQQSNISILATNGLEVIVALSYSGSTTIFPYRASSTSRTVATANSFYIISVGSCT